jgi:TPP-dependent pyruvate/acetoin dehydrogenase alpha subunit
MSGPAEALYRRVYLIRRAEEAIIARYRGDEMKTPVHLSVGQEAVAAGVCQALGPEDQCLSSYRSHGVYLARTLETDRFFAELYGRATGVAKGKAGSMHLSSKAHGFLASSAVVATPIPMAVGAALANLALGRAGWVAVFFGDGAVDEGVFYESLNLACLKRLPLIFVCEDNGLAIHSPAKDRHAHPQIVELARLYSCETAFSESTLAQEVYDLTREARARASRAGRPLFLHLRCYRYLEHVGIGEDFEAGYRSREEFTRWRERDPVLLQRRHLAREIPEEAIRKLEETVDRQIAASIAFAESSPFPDPEELFTDVLA